jgi:hypothetical protein
MERKAGLQGLLAIDKGFQTLILFLLYDQRTGTRFKGQSNGPEEASLTSISDSMKLPKSKKLR